MTNRAYLLHQCNGAGINITEMGTTGLVAWVLTGNDSPSINRWDRWNMAKRIIESRKLSVTLFAAAIVQTGKRHSVNLNRFISALDKRSIPVMNWINR